MSQEELATRLAMFLWCSTPDELLNLSSSGQLSNVDVLTAQVQRMLADPGIAKMTLKQRIEDHRNQPACLSCHVKINPWGITFENFDAVGSWRTEIRGQPVDASSLLFNGQKLDGVDALKRFLLENRQDQFARPLVHKMTIFAPGRPLTFGDRASIDQITADLHRQNDGLGTLVTLIVLSDLFQSKWMHPPAERRYLHI